MITFIVGYIKTLTKKQWFFLANFILYILFISAWLFDFYETKEPNFDVLFKAIQVFTTFIGALTGLL